MRVLLVEDDRKLADHLSSHLRMEGFMVSHCSTRDELLDTVAAQPASEVLVLDRLLGDFDSRSALGEIRRRWGKVPILVLSAISTPNERAELLDCGVDDYMGKPFSTLELVARIRALARRNGANDRVYVQAGDLTLDLIRRQISVGSQGVTPPSKEFLLLRTLCEQPGRVWSRDQLLDAVWGQNFMTETNTVEATVANLRKRLASLGSRVAIKNSRNVGYWVEE